MVEIVDYYSKFPEISEMTNITSEETIKELKQMYGKHGIPKLADNGPV